MERVKQELRVVGLTGGIGTGKSTAAEYLKGKGFAHIDADAISRCITSDGSPMLSVLDGLFGPSGQFGKEGVEILHPDGSLDRAALASLVFTDKERKRELDRVMFQAIIAEIDAQIDALRKAAAAAGMDETAHTDKMMRMRRRADCEAAADAGEAVGVQGSAVYKAGAPGAETKRKTDADEILSGERAVTGVENPIGILLDAPLLFEAGLDERCDLVLLFVADEAARIRRVCSRDGVTEQEVRDRINSQLSDDEKKAKSDIIIDNSGSQEELARKLENFLQQFSKNSCKHFSMVL